MEEATIAVLSSKRASQVLAKAGWTVLEIERPDELSISRPGEAPRVLVIGGGRSGPRRIEEWVARARSVAPLLDVIAWKPGASGEWVRAALKAGGRDVVLTGDSEDLRSAVQSVLAGQRLLPQVEQLSRTRQQSGSFEGLVSRNDSMWEIFETIARVADSAASILIVGDTGTGKERLARAIHRRSGRDGRFVAVNCSALRPEIARSELFGHEKGAFTGAARAKPGLFRHADGGTLLLDEIGDMTPDTQLSLLRVLEEGRIRPVGAANEIAVNVRVVAATNARLEAAIGEGTFREDLYYRLNVIRLDIPALSDRKEDILYLFGHFLRIHCKRQGIPRPKVSQRVIERMTDYEWPGNVRQLENTVERLVLEGRRRELTLRDVNRILPRTGGSGDARNAQPAEIDAISSPTIDPEKSLAENVEMAVAGIERRYLTRLLRETGGVVGTSAERAGISRRTMTRKLAGYEIDPKTFR